MLTKRTLILLACVIFAGDAVAGSLCLPIGCKGKALQSDQRGIIFYHKRRQELVIRIDYDIRDADTPITKLGWIIPVPNKPDTTGTANTAAFGELDDFTTPYFVDEKKPPANRGRELAEDMPRNAPTITPMSAPGKAGVKAVNIWLDRHGLQAIRPEALAYYAARRWFFVAVLFEDPQEFPACGRLTPVRIVFDARRIHYPILLCADEGTFDLTLYIFCKGRIDRKELGTFGLTLVELEPDKMKQSNRITRVSNLPKESRRLFDAVAVDPVLAKLGQGRIFLYRVYAHDMNGTEERISEWETDLQLSAPIGSPLSPYINIMVGLAAVIAVFVLARTKRRVAQSRASSGQ